MRKLEAFLIGAMVLCLVAVVFLFPFGNKVSAGKDKKEDKSQKLSNYDAFLASPAAEESPLRGPRKTVLEHLDQAELRLGVPTFLWARGGAVNAARPVSGAVSNETAVNAARLYIGEHAAEYRLAKTDLPTIYPAAVHDTGKGAIIVKFKQAVNGVEVFRDEMNVLMNRRLELIALSGYLTGGTEQAASSADYQLQPEDAIAVAARDLTGAAVNTAFLNRAEASFDEKTAPQQKYLIFSAGDYAMENFSFSPAAPPRVKKVFYRLPDRLVPAFYVEISVAGETKNSAAADMYYSFVIAASDGSILFRNNLTIEAEFSYRVFADENPPFTVFDSPAGNDGTPHPTGVPDGYAPPFVTPKLVTLQNIPFSQNDPWLPDGAIETSGNNVDAYADLTAPDGYNAGDLRPTVTSPGAFDRTYLTDNQPSANPEQIAAAATQLFFTVNYLHDWFYDHGFNEAAGNAQYDNFGRGGLGNDRIRAEAQDHGGINNANMSTPADGVSPRMQMYIFSGPANNFLHVNAPASVAGRYETGVANDFGPQTFDLTGEVVLALDEANPTGPATTDACTPLTNGAQVAGKIAFIDRGSCAFTIKMQNAQDVGAIGVIIADNVAGPIAGMGGTSSTITIPSLRITKASGDAIRSHAGPGGLNVRLFRGPVTNRDGTLDNQIVAHEWGHYISNRLIGNSNGLTTNQSRGLGEGWGDFHGLLLTARPEDITVPANANWNGVYSLAGYSTPSFGNNSFYYGIRRLPYSTDFTKNPLTFKHISDGVALPTTAPIKANGANSQVHNTGEIWATMLWECYVSLLRAHPFQEAQDRMKSYLVNGYKMTPVNPTFVEARNAILAAAVASDPADFQRLSAAFVRRGMGVRAVAPDRNSSTNAGVVESTNMGGDLTFTGGSMTVSGGDGDAYLDNGETGTLNFSLKNTGFSSLSSTTATVSCDNGNVLFPGGISISMPNSEPFGADINGSINVAMNGSTAVQSATCSINFNDPGITIGTPAPGAILFGINMNDHANATTIDRFETNLDVWTRGGDTSLDPGNIGAWQRIRPAGGFSNQLWYGPDVSFASDQYLISPDLIIDSSGSLTMQFDHSFNFETDAGVNYDGGVIEMRVDGGPWTDIGGAAYNGVLTNYAGNLNPLAGRSAFVGNSGGTVQTIITAATPLGASLAPGSVVNVRFRTGADNAIGGGGWQVDNVAFSGISNTPFPMLTPQAGPTAADVTVSGRVLSAARAGVAGARVWLTDAEGNARMALTNHFGYYRFDDVEVGQTYVVSVAAKRLQFAPQIVTPTENLPDLNFMPVE